MKKKLKEELRKLSTDIITSRDMNTIGELYESAKNLYEKLAVLRFIEEKLNHVEVDGSKNVIAAKFEKMANAVLSENSSVPESNPHEEDIMIPLSLIHIYEPTRRTPKSYAVFGLKKK